MATDNSVISKMQIQQLLHWCCNVRRSAILHNKFAVHTSALLQCWNELVAQKRFITCPIDCSGYRARRTNLLEKERDNDKCCGKPVPHSDLLRMKRQWLHLERILSCPYSTILSIDRTLEMEMVFHVHKMFHGHALSTSIRERNCRLKASRFGRSSGTNS
ncbi:hypothetical protein AVEN_204471-1 [Araneus ventricosus]|uniref:Uncharacterized protein n=1 Tax=Araneus ventricosus TaxID=182803 RepID=A0A4Y2W589_ARAVE|nr:hypothetical protein AVEN_204471-1 [Araneus ventricosus]